MVPKLFQLSILFSLLFLGNSPWTQAQFPCHVTFSQIDSGNTVYFSAIDSGAFNPLYAWTIHDAVNGNTTTLTGANPMFTFSGASASHYVCLTMTDTVYNCQTSYCDSVMTSGTTAPNCSVYFNYADSGNTVYFNAVGNSAMGSTYFWQITDANNGTTTNLWGEHPTFTFSGASSSHYACVTIFDTVTNCQAIYCDTIMTSGTTTSNCSVYFNYADSGNTVYFNAVGNSAMGSTYFWQITDANNGTTTNLWGEHPTFTFSGASSSHYACVTIFDTVTSCQATYCDTVLLQGATSNCNNTSVNYTTSVQGHNVVFYGNATGFDPNTVSYLWSFGTVGRVTQGTFPAGWTTICLIVSDSTCTQTFCDSFYVNPNNCSGAVSIGSSYVTNSTVNFTSTITGGNGGYTYHWNLGDNNISLNANPTHTYGPPYGDYTVSLVVQDSLGCVFTATDSVFIMSPVVNCNDNEVTLTLNHDNYAGETSWDVVNNLGGIVASGTSYTWMNNTTTYETLCLPAGCYTLNVYDTWGDGMCCAYGNGSYTLSDTTGVVLATGGSFNFIDSRSFCVGGASTPCGNLSHTTISHVQGANGDVTFSTNTTGSVQPMTYDWTVDGVGVATSSNPTVTLTNGLHSYCLVVMDITGNCVATICDSVLITNANTGPQGCAGIVPDMTIVQDSINPYQLYVQPILNNVTAGSSFIFYWSFGDNSGAFGGQTAHNYNNYGSYNLCFVAIDSVSGCIINHCDTITLDSLGTFSRFINKPGFSINTLAPILNTNINTTNLETRTWEVELFPNPANEKVNLQMNAPTAINGQVNIVSVTGQVVQQQVLHQAAGSSQLQLSVADLPAGVYFVRIETAEEQQTLKFIKE